MQPNDEYPRRASLWPFRTLRSLAFLAGIAGAGFGILDAADLAVGLLIGGWVAFATVLVGIIPAAVIALLDAALIGPRPVRRVRWRHQSQVRGYSLAGAAVGLAVGAAFGFTYHHAFFPTTDIGSLLFTGAVAGTTTGLIAGRICGLTLGSPGTQSSRIVRTAIIWGLAVAGISYVAYQILHDGNTTLLPGALLALIGAAVVPQLAASRPIDLSTIPPPRAVDLSRIPPPPGPAAAAPHPSPGPHSPEGGPGEGERGATGRPRLVQPMSDLEPLEVVKWITRSS